MLIYNYGNSYATLKMWHFSCHFIIKDYVLRGMREDLMKLDASSCTTLFQYILILELGMFNTVAAALNATTYTNTDLEALRVKWIPLLKSANDIKTE